MEAKPTGQFIYRAAHILLRATGGIRRRPWLHLLSTLTLAAAFLSFAATLTVARNLNHLIDRWVGNSEMTVYLKDTSTADLERLRNAIAAIDGVERVEVIRPSAARQNFARDLGAFGDLGATLPEAAFPASIDIHLSRRLADNDRERHALSARLSKVHMVEEVEVYDDWFKRLSAMSTMGRTASWGLGILAAIVAILVVAATVRTGVAARRKEIAVLRLVGATETYVRTPFLIEGGIEAAIAMGIALFCLQQMMNHVDAVVGGIMPLLGGGRILRLESTWLLFMVVGGLLAGLVGARLSLRRLEEA